MSEYRRSVSSRAILLSLTGLLALPAEPAAAKPKPAPRRPANPPGPTAATAQSGPRQPGPGPCKPWVCGVSDERQQRATELYEDGNELYEAALFVGAAARYRAALSYWDHPAIHYNLALAQLGLDQPLAAFRSLQAALRHQGDALEPEMLDQARDKLAGLHRQIAAVRVVCAEPEAMVTLDGKPLFTGPGAVDTLVLAGPHQIDARKPNYVSASKSVHFAPGQRTTLTLTLIPERDAIRRVRRWNPWSPWITATVGTAVGAVGLALHRQSSTEYGEFTRRFRAQCPNGCPGYPPGLQERYDRARQQQGLAYGAYVTGGLAVVGGLTMAYLNRERLLENQALGHLVRVSLAPIVSAEMTGIGAGGSF